MAAACTVTSIMAFVLGQCCWGWGKEEVELPFILLGKCFFAMGSCQNYNVDSDALASKTSDGGMPSISMNFLWFWSETTERWGFVVLLIVYVPKRVCKTLLTVTYFL